MARNVGTNSRFAAAFATLMCAWVVALAVLVLGLTSEPRPAEGLPTPTVLTAR
jgi:hypothetical protein